MVRYELSFASSEYVFHKQYHMTETIVDGLVQERFNSIANWLELSFSCTNLFI